MGKKLTIEDAVALASAKGGQLISNVYINSRTRLIWKCSDPLHSEWLATYNTIQQGRWCPCCATDKRRLTLTDAQRLANLRGGGLISTEYLNAQTNLLWSCGNEDHPAWWTSYSHIKQGSWCPACANDKRFLVLEEVAHFVQSRGGSLISAEYINAHAPLSFECSLGHRWQTSYNNIQQGSWCPECGGVKRRTLEDAVRLAQRRGGLLISKKFINVNQPLYWECGAGHQWSASYDSIQRGGWCPACSSSLHERVCRITLEQLLGVNFPKTRKIPWLVNSRNNKMEIDCYSDKMKLGLEYDGGQHRKVVQHFGMTQKKLVQRQIDDVQKDKLCLKHGVTLLRVSEGSILLIPGIIYRHLKAFSYDLLCSAEEVDLSAAYFGDYTDETLSSFLEDCINFCGHVPTHQEWAAFARPRGYPLRRSIRRRFGSWVNFLALNKHEVRPQEHTLQYTKEDLCRYFCQYIQSYGQSFTDRAWGRYAKAKKLPAIGTYRRYFGSLKAAKQAALDFMPEYLRNLETALTPLKTPLEDCAVVCQTCNSKKQVKDVDEWLKTRPESNRRNYAAYLKRKEEENK